MKSIFEVVRDLIKPYIDKNANNIAPVEVSPAETAHTVGTQLIYNGVLYDVILAISATDELEEGTNISPARNVSTQIITAQNAVKNNTKENGVKNIIPFPYNGYRTGTFTSLTVNDDCSVSFSCSTGDNKAFYITRCSGNGADPEVSKTLCDTLKGNTYVLTGRKGYVNVIIDYYDSNTSYISSQQSPISGAVTLVVPNNAVYAQMYIGLGSSYSFDDTIYPMICLKTDYDFSSAYTPCAKTNIQLSRETDDIYNIVDDKMDWESGNILGSKNILFNQTKTSYIDNGITWTYNASNGTINVNGTASNRSDYVVKGRNGEVIGDAAVNKVFPSAGRYIATIGDEVGPSGSNATVAGYFNIYKLENGTDTFILGEWLTSDVPSYEFEVTEAMLNDSSYWVQYGIVVFSGKTANNKTMYPMIRPASIKDDTYVPYAMTNRLITSNIMSLLSTVSDIKRCSINHIGGSTYTGPTISNSIASAFPESVGTTTFVGTYNWNGQNFIMGYIYWSSGKPYINAIILGFGRCQYVYCMGVTSSAALRNITNTAA